MEHILPKKHTQFCKILAKRAHPLGHWPLFSFSITFHLLRLAGTRQKRQTDRQTRRQKDPVQSYQNISPREIDTVSKVGPWKLSKVRSPAFNYRIIERLK